MTVPRTVVLAAIAGGAVVVALVARAPAPGPARPHGPRLVRVPAAAIRAVTVVLDARRIALRRRGDGWEVDGRPAGREMADAAGEVVAALARLRALDAFRGADDAVFGFSPERGTLLLETEDGTERVVVGGLNAAGSAFYARRDGDHRVFQVGVGFLSLLDRVLWLRDG